MGFDNILANRGLGIAGTGMTIVFGALTLITVFVYALPKVLSVLALAVPAMAAAQQAPSSAAGDEEEVAAVIGFALHQREAQAN